MVNRSVLGFTNRTKEESQAAFGKNASMSGIPGRPKPLTNEERHKNLIAFLDSRGQRMSKESHDKLLAVYAAAKLRKRQKMAGKKSSLEPKG